MTFIDTHTHLNDDVYSDYGIDMVQKAIDAGVEFMILPGTSLTELESMKALAARYPEHIRMFAGLHPTELTSDVDGALDVIRKELDTPDLPYVGVGEIGIDLHEASFSIEKQMYAFDAQCRMAIDRKLPINIHCRDGLEQTLEVLRGLPEIPNGAFHCFGGTPRDVERIREVGDFYFGINGIVTFKNSGLRETLPSIGLDRIILETDSPYLSPVPFRGKLNDSSYIPLIAQTIAQTLGVTLETVAQITTSSARKLYSI
ncbi:MAG: TatD family hydrolase [Bacteroidales bacterium]|nr:TatD family hydrolase [Bacteroidales bacterium]